MDYDTFEKEAKKIYVEWLKEREEIEKKAKAEGTWCYFGLDSNNHLFKESFRKAIERTKELRKQLGEEVK